MLTPTDWTGLDHYLGEFTTLLAQVDRKQVQTMVDLVEQAYVDEKTVFIIGNGGSGANASHLCEDLGKGTLHDFEKQRRLKVMSLTDNTPYILAWGNDTAYDRIFVEQLKNFVEKGAVLIAISGSGNSPNVLKAIEYANAHGMKTLVVTGYDGGKLKTLAHHNVHVPSWNMGMVESVHSALFHYLLDALYHKFKALNLAAAPA
ncbi:MAG: SIS domain-containing protein [Planctomycetota bacterium]|nr:MAG: SIS domain-containing protein [Planctomycetota bacterium]